MNFREFTDNYVEHEGEKLLINMDYVVSITQAKDGTCRLWTCSEEENFSVKESFLEVKQMVIGANKEKEG